ncbi:hypothetical protein [Marinobacter mobilis]|uniref:Uncharacterized protein n=1 Tax=Marinobacter mobilis TaxID=488533 RepID=A0A1H2S9K0_9GAMM|nr:hypothetical protein [Marinobacter mobilis]SDW28361.1 hypothetical protein SAMN04487960_10268 [Marinobacter mobilis]
MLARIALLVFLLPQWALAEDLWEFDVVNQTGYDIYYVYASHISGECCFCDDALGDNILANGETFTLLFTPSAYRSPRFDVRVEDVDGDTYSFMDVDVTGPALVITLDDLD